MVITVSSNINFTWLDHVSLIQHSLDTLGCSNALKIDMTLTAARAGSSFSITHKQQTCERVSHRVNVLNAMIQSNGQHYRASLSRRPVLIQTQKRCSKSFRASAARLVSLSLVYLFVQFLHIVVLKIKVKLPSLPVVKLFKQKYTDCAKTLLKKAVSTVCSVFTRLTFGYLSHCYQSMKINRELMTLWCWQARNRDY